MTIKKFKKKPVIVEAIQYDGKNINEIIEFTKTEEIEEDFIDSELVIKTLEGNMHATAGDWIIKGVEGEFYHCKPNIFEKTYEEVK